MLQQLWNRTVALLKGIRPTESKPGQGWIEVGAQDVGGHRFESRLFQHKVARLAGDDARLLKIELHWEPATKTWELPTSLPDCGPITAAWAEPGSKNIYCLYSPLVNGPNFQANLEELGGLTVTWTPKTYKRLKRLFSVDCLKAIGGKDFSFRVTADEKAPVPVTDGMCFIRTEFVCNSLADHQFRQGDMLMVSMLTPQGMFKGHAVLMDELDRDVVIPGSHNMKQEVKYGENLLFLEAVLKSGPITTDLQTIINTGDGMEFKRAWEGEMQYLARLWDDAHTRKQFLEEFESVDWWQKQQNEAAEERRQTKEAEPAEEVAPVLTMASHLGLNASVSPRLISAIWHYEAARTNLKRLKVPVRRHDDRHLNGLRGYACPDLSQFRNGEFCPNPELALGTGMTAYPDGKLPPGEVLQYRQPNGPGEYAIRLNTPASIKSRTAVQFSVLDLDPSLAKYYPGMTAPTESILPIHGGFDFDDSFCGLVDERTIHRAARMERARKAADCPRVNTEAIIDRAKQVPSKWTIEDQVRLATIRTELPLGPATNFIMALTMMKDWELLKIVAEQKTEEGLKVLHDWYYGLGEHARQEPARVPDLWQPENRETPEKGCRVPVVSWRPFQYAATVPVWTRLGGIVAGAILRTNALMDHVHKDGGVGQAWICSEAGIKFLRGLVKNPAAWPAGTTLAALWHRLRGWGKQMTPDIEALIPSMDDCKSLSWDLRERCWSHLAWEVYGLKDLSGDALMEVVAATAVALFIRPTSRGRDGMLWQVARDQAFEPIHENGYIVEGIRGAWLTILMLASREMQK